MIPSLSKLSHEQLTSGVQPPVSHTFPTPETLWGNGLSCVAIASLADLRHPGARFSKGHHAKFGKIAYVPARFSQGTPAPPAWVFPRAQPSTFRNLKSWQLNPR